MPQVLRAPPPPIQYNGIMALENVSDEDLAKQSKTNLAAKNELIKRYKSLVEKRTNMYRGVGVPQPAIYGEGLRLIQYAAETYKPGHDTKFSTHLENHLRRMSRYVNTHKSIARIPASKQMRIGLYQSRFNVLKLKFGREPAPEELADDLGWGVNDVLEVQRMLRPELAASGLSSEAETTEFSDRLKETAMFVRFQLSPEEQVVFDYLHGHNGKKQETDVASIARHSGVSTDKVYRTIKKIRELINRHL